MPDQTPRVCETCGSDDPTGYGVGGYVENTGRCTDPFHDPPLSPEAGQRIYSIVWTPGGLGQGIAALSPHPPLEVREVIPLASLARIADELEARAEAAVEMRAKARSTSDTVAAIAHGEAWRTYRESAALIRSSLEARAALSDPPKESG